MQTVPDSAVFPNDTHSYQHDKICGLEIQTGMLIQFVGTREQREMGTLFFICSYWKCRQVSQVSQAAHHSRKWKKAHWPHNTYRMYSARTMIKKPAMVHIWRPSRGPEENYISWDMWLYHTPEIQERKRSHLLSYVKIKIKWWLKF